MEQFDFIRHETMLGYIEGAIDVLREHYPEHPRDEYEKELEKYRAATEWMREVARTYPEARIVTRMEYTTLITTFIDTLNKRIQSLDLQAFITKNAIPDAPAFIFTREYIDTANQIIIECGKKFYYLEIRTRLLQRLGLNLGTLTVCVGSESIELVYDKDNCPRLIAELELEGDARIEAHGWSIDEVQEEIKVYHLYLVLCSVMRNLEKDCDFEDDAYTEIFHLLSYLFYRLYEEQNFTYREFISWLAVDIDASVEKLPDIMKQLDIGRKEKYSEDEMQEHIDFYMKKREEDELCVSTCGYHLYRKKHAPTLPSYESFFARISFHDDENDKGAVVSALVSWNCRKQGSFFRQIIEKGFTEIVEDMSRYSFFEDVFELLPERLQKLALEKISEKTDRGLFGCTLHELKFILKKFPEVRNNSRLMAEIIERSSESNILFLFGLRREEIFLDDVGRDTRVFEGFPFGMSKHELRHCILVRGNEKLIDMVFRYLEENPVSEDEEPCQSFFVAEDIKYVWFWAERCWSRNAVNLIRRIVTDIPAIHEALVQIPSNDNVLDNKYYPNLRYGHGQGNLRHKVIILFCRYSSSNEDIRWLFESGFIHNVPEQYHLVKWRIEANFYDLAFLKDILSNEIWRMFDFSILKLLEEKKKYNIENDNTRCVEKLENQIDAVLSVLWTGEQSHEH